MKFSCLFGSHKMHLWAGPFRSHHRPEWQIYLPRIPTLSYTWSIKKVPFRRSIPVPAFLGTREYPPPPPPLGDDCCIFVLLQSDVTCLFFFWGCAVILWVFFETKWNKSRRILCLSVSWVPYRLLAIVYTFSKSFASSFLVLVVGPELSLSRSLLLQKT